MSDFDIGINEFKILKAGYSLHINGKLVRQDIKDLEGVVKEIKKYLRLRFKESLK